jgi:hypothetical protein
MEKVMPTFKYEPLVLFLESKTSMRRKIEGILMV